MLGNDVFQVFEYGKGVRHFIDHIKILRLVTFEEWIKSLRVWLLETHKMNDLELQEFLGQNRLIA